MNTIQISINNLIATAPENARIVSENSGYQIEFAFDGDWAAYTLKTAVFVWYQDSLPYCQTVPFSGNVVAVPRMHTAGTVYVGVTAGNTHTTTPAEIKCCRSILSSGGQEPEAPTESEYAKLMELLNATQGASAYELAVYNGYEGSQTQWLESLKGEPGPQGEQGIQGQTGPAGADGRTPIRGKDYWTSADKSAILYTCNTYLLEELASRGRIMPAFASDISGCTDTGNLYVLPDGYLYAYGQVSTSLGDGTNLADRTSADWLKDQRMSTGSAIYACEGAVVTNYIPVSEGDVIRVKALDMVNEMTNYFNTPKSGCYDADKNELFVNVALSGSVYWTYAVEGDVAVITITHPDVAYMRFCGEPHDGYTAADIVITRNEKEFTVSDQWFNTRHAFVADPDGTYTTETGENAHAEGYMTKALGDNAHAEGIETTASGVASHAEGENTRAIGEASHAEGFDTSAHGLYAHAEGECSAAVGDYSHAEGQGSVAYGAGGHAEGFETEAGGECSHAEGVYTEAYGICAHAEGDSTQAKGGASHAEGEGTIAAGRAQHTEGKWNIEDTQEQFAHIIGNGNSGSRSNAHTLDWNGNAWYAGTVEGTGLILKSLAGVRFLITVSDTGVLNTAQIN